MHAIILAGGGGTRLRPLTCTLSKPMVPISGKPILEHTLSLLRTHKLGKPVCSVCYRGDEIEEFLSDRALCLKEETPRGTAGGVLDALPYLSDPFVVLSGDALTDCDLTQALRFHKEKKALCTLVLKRVEDMREYGVVLTDSQGRITRFVEKPSFSRAYSDLVNTGIYIINKEALHYVSQDAPCDFGKDLWPFLLNRGEALYGYEMQGYWCDIGEPNAYRQAQMDALEGKIALPTLQNGRESIAPDTRIEPGAMILPPVLLGHGCVIKSGAKIGPGVALGNHVRVAQGASVQRSVLWDDVQVDKDALLQGAVVLNGAHVGERAQLYDGAVLGSYAMLMEDAVLHAASMVWPEKVVPSGAQVSGSLIWGAAGTPYLMQRGLCGLPDQCTPSVLCNAALNIGQMLWQERGKKAPAAILDDTEEAHLSQEEARWVQTSSLNEGAVLPTPTAENSRPGQRDTTQIVQNREENQKTPKNKPEETCPTALVCCDGEGASQMALHAFVSGLGAAGIKVYQGGIATFYALMQTQREFQTNLCVYLYTQDGRIHADLYNEKGQEWTREQHRNLSQALLRGEVHPRPAENMPSSPRLVGLEKKALEHFIKRYQLSLPLKGAICKAEREVQKHTCACLFERGEENAVLEIAPDGESYLIMDEKGRPLDPCQLPLLFAQMQTQWEQQGLHESFCAPADSTLALKDYAKKENLSLKIVSPTRAALQKAAWQSENAYTLYFSGIQAFALLMQYCKNKGMKLSEWVDSLPPVRMLRTDIPCPSHSKGRIMHRLLERTKDMPVETDVGLRIEHPFGWVWIRPLDDKAILRLICEGRNAEFAKEIDVFYKKLIEEEMQT